MMADVITMRVEGMDCPSCAAKIEKAVSAIPGVNSVKVSITSQLMTVEGQRAASPAISKTVTGLGYAISAADKPAPVADPSYKRALWIVVLLNVGFGLCEIIGGYIAGSQALKADALDFLGDGAITFLGIVAIGWSLVWRARSALIQGIFLGVLGMGVFATTIYRLFVTHAPEAEIMGALGLVALAVNVAAALVLVPHRQGDANVRAVWLFSRNDAIGNAAVVLAAGLVYWTGSAWPDLAVALVIAALFLHSSLRIIRDASSELQGSK